MKSDNYYHNKIQVNIKKEIKWKYKHLKPHLNQKVLDIGCGDGKILRMSERWHGIDNDERSASLNSDRNFKRGSIMSIPYDDNEFDGAVISHVLEHVPREKTEEAIAEVTRILKKGAFILIYSPFPLCTHYYNALDHINPINLVSTYELLERKGYEVIDKGYSLFRFFPYKIQEWLIYLFPYLASEFYVKAVKK